jgi:NAD-dependent deacetylase
MEDTLSLQARNCAELIRSSESIVLLSGAGMSTSAGIPDFRGPDGIYRKKMNTDPELIFDIDQFRRDPAFFYRFHREFVKSVESVEPTFSHYFFAELEKSGKMHGVITQNIDALHQKAGSRKVLEIHGSSWKSYCTSCGAEYDYNRTLKMMENETVPHCEKCGGVIKPDIVFFGENVKYLYECQKLSQETDLMFIIGSSLIVTPAAFLPGMCNGKLVIVNKGDISFSYLHKDSIEIFAEQDIDTFFSEVNNYL